MAGRREGKWVQKILSAIALIATAFVSFAQQVEKVSPAGTRFLLYTPPGYNAGGGPYPLLIVLHGQGGLGDNINLLINKDEIPSRLIAQNQWPSHYPFIVVTPQLKRDPSVPDPAEQKWPPEMIDEVVEYVRSGYAVDGSRMYITGLSQGSHGSYDYTIAFPEKIAAAVYISGAPDSTVACSAKDVPIWNFHGTDDGLVPPVFGPALIRALEACSPPGKFRPHLNMLYGRRHEGWNEVYNLSSGYDIYTWMLKFRKNSPANTVPYVSAGADMTIADRDHYLHVYGDVFDSDGTISSIQWTKISGPAVTMEETHTPFLRLSNLNPGTYEFRLRATDDDGGQATDDVKITIAAGTGSFAVTGLTLLNGNNQQTIASLTEGYVVNPNALFKNQINIRAQVTGAVGSVRFRINGNRNARTSGTAPYELGTPRWTAEGGEYLVCATPYSGSNGNGTAGVSQCFKMVISATATPLPPPPPDSEEPEEPVDPEEPEEPVEPEEPENPEEPVEPEEPEEPEEPVDPEEPAPVVTHFYARPNMDLSALESWSSNAQGTGTAPTSFTVGGQTFDVQTTAVIDNPLAIGGTGSVFRVRPGGRLTLNSTLNVPIHVEAGAEVHVNTSQPVIWGTLSPTSTVHFNAAVTTIPLGTYGQVFVNGAGTSKKLSAGTTTMAGNLTVASGVMLDGADTGASALAILRDVAIQSAGTFLPAKPFTVIFQRGAAQKFAISAGHVLFHEIIVRPGSVVDVTGMPANSTFEVGTPSGGSLTVDTGAQFHLRRTQLLITGGASINPQNQTGQIAFRQSSLRISSSAVDRSYLYTLSGADSVSALTVDVPAAGILSLGSVLYIKERVDPVNGIIQSNGFMSLVSTPLRTARLLPSAGTGSVAGDVVFQRFIPKGKQTRYLSLPVAGVTVGDVQPFIAVTGSFTGASTGDGLPDGPSLSYYDETSGGWISFPQGHNGETFIVGRGYAFEILDGARDKKLIVSGPVHQDDFAYSLAPNPQNDPSRGWNLIGNPYAAPIQWDASLTREHTAPAAYILDDRYPGGRFFVWDGEVGDPEFSGIIGQGQAFFVRTTGASPALTVTPQAIADTATRIWRTKQNESQAEYLTITLMQNDLVDRAFMKFSEQGDDRFNEDDAVKRQNGYFNLASLSADSVSLAINEVSETFCDRNLPLVLDATAGSYTLQFDGTRLRQGGVVNLFDRFTDRVVPLQSGTSYNFQITSDPRSFDKHRFEIQIPSATMEDPVIAVAENVLTSSASAGNQWFLNGEPIEGATASSFTPAISGEYTVEVTRDGCSRRSQPVLVTVTVTGIKEGFEQTVNLYPNPAAQWIRVQLNTASSEEISYSITSSLGAQVLGGEMDAALLRKGADIDLSGLASGVYFISVHTRRAQYREKIVIERSRP